VYEIVYLVSNATLRSPAQKSDIGTGVALQLVLTREMGSDSMSHTMRNVRLYIISSSLRERSLHFSLRWSIRAVGLAISFNIRGSDCTMLLELQTTSLVAKLPLRRHRRQDSHRVVSYSTAIVPIREPLSRSSSAFLQHYSCIRGTLRTTFDCTSTRIARAHKNQYFNVALSEASILRQVNQRLRAVPVLLPYWGKLIQPYLYSRASTCQLIQ
jgi:hypothetical protein